MSICAMDAGEWQAGFRAGMKHDRRGVVGASWSWLGGWIEGDAARRKLSSGDSVKVPRRGPRSGVTLTGA